MQISNGTGNKSNKNKNTLSPCSSYKMNNLPVNKNNINTHGGVNTITNGSNYKAT